MDSKHGVHQRIWTKDKALIEALLAEETVFLKLAFYARHFENLLPDSLTQSRANLNSQHEPDPNPQHDATNF